MAPETPKGISSRLLTMKFMQRAAASASPAESPDSNSHTAKKRKLGDSPSQGRFNASIDQAAIKAALEDQEAKRQAALEKHVGADAHWTMNKSWVASQTKAAKTQLNVVYVGYGVIDTADDSDDNEDVPERGRTSTKGHGKSKNQKSKVKAGTESSSDSSDSESNDAEDSSSGRKRKLSSDSPNLKSDRSRSSSRSQPKQSKENAKAKEFREKRKKKEVKLNKLTSISSAGDSSLGGRSSPSSKSLICYTCQQPGHKSSDCPSKGNARGRPQKR